MAKKLLASCLAAIFAVAATAAFGAKHYPYKPVRLIVPFAAGGNVDIVTRVIARKLTENLGQQVVIDNRGGAGGVIGTELAAKALPDGYTLLMVTASHVTNPGLRKLPYDRRLSRRSPSLLTYQSSWLSIRRCRCGPCRN